MIKTVVQPDPALLIHRRFALGQYGCKNIPREIGYTVEGPTELEAPAETAVVKKPQQAQDPNVSKRIAAPSQKKGHDFIPLTESLKEAKKLCREDLLARRKWILEDAPESELMTIESVMNLFQRLCPLKMRFFRVEIQKKLMRLSLDSGCPRGMVAVGDLRALI